MDFDRPAEGRSRRLMSLGLVVLLHAVVIWALTSGVGPTVIERLQKPIEVAIIAEVPAPPPQQPPPPVPKPVEAVRVTERAPAVVAPPPLPAPVVLVPEAAVPAALPAPVIQVTQERPAPAPAVQPTVSAAAPPAEAPPARVASRIEVAIVCPGYREILQSRLAGQWDRVGVSGVVKVLIRVRGNQILEVTPQSGPREYYRAVQNAVMRMKCSIEGADEQVVPLEVAFREP